MFFEKKKTCLGFSMKFDKNEQKFHLNTTDSVSAVSSEAERQQEGKAANPKDSLMQTGFSVCVFLSVCLCVCFSVCVSVCA